MTASPEAIRTAVNEFPNPNTAVSQPVANRVGGTVLGGAKKPAKKSQGAEADPAGQAARRDGQRLRRAGCGDEAEIALQKAGWKHTGVGGTLPQTNLFSTAVYYTAPRARPSAERLRRSLGDTDRRRCCRRR